MNITNIEFVAPTAANPMGSISFSAVVPVTFSPDAATVSEQEDADVKLTIETQEAVRKAGEMIIADITKPQA